MTNTAMTTATRRPMSRTTCDHLVTTEDTDFICMLREGHEGDHALIDAMGMCLDHDDCRARRQGADRTFTDADRILHHIRCPQHRH